MIYIYIYMYIAILVINSQCQDVHFGLTSPADARYPIHTVADLCANQAPEPTRPGKVTEMDD